MKQSSADLRSRYPQKASPIPGPAGQPLRPAPSASLSFESWPERQTEWRLDVGAEHADRRCRRRRSPAPAAFMVISPIFGQLVMFSMPSRLSQSARTSTGRAISAKPLKARTRALPKLHRQEQPFRARTPGDILLHSRQSATASLYEPSPAARRAESSTCCHRTLGIVTVLICRVE